MLTSALVLLGFCSLGAEEKPREEGLVPVFNGKDFHGWRFTGKDQKPANWKVEDGLIKLSGGGSPHLASEWDYEDFEMKFQWRAVKDRYNSGFYVRSARNMGTNQLNLAKGSEGALIGGKVTGSKKVPELQNKPGEWNEWHVKVVGDRITFWCNGKLAWEGSDLKPARGYVGLQAEGAALEFRNLRIREIGAVWLMQPDAWELPSGAGAFKDDTLTLTGKAAGGVKTKKAFGNAVLRLEWKADKGAEGFVKLGVAPEVPIGEAAKDRAIRPGWNFTEIRVEGGSLTVWHNGEAVTRPWKPVQASAPVVLRSTGPIDFRAIRIRELK